MGLAGRLCTLWPWAQPQVPEVWRQASRMSSKSNAERSKSNETLLLILGCHVTCHVRCREL